MAIQGVSVESDRGTQMPYGGATIDLLALFWRRRRIVIGCMLLALLAAVVYCEVVPTVYESTAEVLVVQKRPQAVTGDPQFQSGFEDYLATHLAIVGSPLIVRRALDANQLGSLPTFADWGVTDDEELVDAIIENLVVEGGPRDLGENADSIMAISFRSEYAEDCPVVVQALLDSYESFHHEVYEGMSGSTVGLIDEARKLLRDDLNQQELDYSEFRKSSPLVARGTDEVNPLQDRLASIEERRSSVLLRRAEIERQIEALQQAEANGVDAQQLLAIVSELRQDATDENGLPDVSTALESQLVQLIDDEQKLLEHYGPKHPHVQGMRDRISAARRYLALPTTAHMSDPEVGDTTPTSASAIDPIAVYKQYLDQQLKGLQISERLLTELYDREHGVAQVHSAFQLSDESLRRGIERTEALYDVVLSRLQEASLIKEFGGFETRVIAPPRLGEKVAPSRRILWPVAAVLGLLLGCVLSAVVELRNRNFLSTDQLQNLLDLPVLGTIPQVREISKQGQRRARSADSDPRLWTYSQPESYATESVRSLRTALQFHPAGQTLKVVQISGASREDGASTVAANLAVSLARAGRRVLLIDAAFGNPVQTDLFGIQRTADGLASVIGGESEPQQAIAPTVVENLWLLPAGQPRADDKERFATSRFVELVQLTRDSYDYVLIDTDPILTTADPELIATQADGVLLVLRMTHQSRPRAQQALSILRRLHATVLGVVANGVELSQQERRLRQPRHSIVRDRESPRDSSAESVDR